MTTYIYALLDPRTEQPHYVGKTINPHKRIKEHMGMARRRLNQGPVTGWLRELVAQDLEAELVILAEVGEDWREAERDWIHKMRQMGYPILNSAPGGAGGPVVPPQPEPAPPRWWHPERGFYVPDPVAP